MTQLHCAVRLPYFTGLPRDVAINTFNFQSVSAISVEDMVDEVHARLLAFYNTGVGAGQSIAQLLGKSIQRANCSIRYYEVPDSGPATMGDPVEEIPFTLAATGTGQYPLPLEVAACISMVGAPDIGGLPIRRRRGRVYIGPLNSNAIGTGDDSYPDVSSLALSVLSANADRLADANDDDARWSVWSRAAWETGSGVLSWSPVAYGWVDNEFDTQRRREMDPTQRTTWGTPLP